MMQWIAAQHSRRRPRLGRLALALSASVIGAGAAAWNASPAGAATRVVLRLTAHSGIGKILVNSAGMTVYIFTADSANTPTCSGGCADIWPPVTVPKGTKPKGGPGVTGLGTVSSGGKLQVTWHKHPLYTYALDTGPGVVNGNGVKEGSGTWFAATAAKVGAKTSGTNGSTGGSGGYGY